MSETKSPKNGAPNQESWDHGDFDGLLFEKDALAYKIMRDEHIGYEEASRKAMEVIKKNRAEERGP